MELMVAQALLVNLVCPDLKEFLEQWVFLVYRALMVSQETLGGQDLRGRRVRMDNLGVMANREHLADRDHLEKMETQGLLVMTVILDLLAEWGFLGKWV